MIKLGLGLIGIGRAWGTHPDSIPSKEDVADFLDFAYELGIRYFNTAPAYGLSEERFGNWLKSKTKAEVESITVATKLGEFWNFQNNEPYREYGTDKLIESIDVSLDLIGKIDIIQVHGFTSEVWNKHSKNILKALNYAVDEGIKTVGVSLSEEKAASIALENELLHVVQLPHNSEHPYSIDIIRDLEKAGKKIVINRPFGKGNPKLFSTHDTRVSAFEYILKDLTEGTILTGTIDKNHLRDNLKAFDEAQKIVK